METVMGPPDWDGSSDADGHEFITHTQSQPSEKRSLLAVVREASNHKHSSLTSAAPEYCAEWTPLSLNHSEDSSESDDSATATPALAAREIAKGTLLRRRRRSLVHWRPVFCKLVQRSKWLEWRVARSEEDDARSKWRARYRVSWISCGMAAASEDTLPTGRGSERSGAEWAVTAVSRIRLRVFSDGDSEARLFACLAPDIADNITGYDCDWTSRVWECLQRIDCFAEKLAAARALEPMLNEEERAELDLAEQLANALEKTGMLARKSTKLIFQGKLELLHNGQWKHLFCKLYPGNPSALSFYDEGQNNPKGTMRLVTGTRIVFDSSDEERAFSVETPVRTCHVRAPHAEARSEWIKSLAKCAPHVNVPTIARLSEGAASSETDQHKGMRLDNKDRVVIEYPGPNGQTKSFKWNHRKQPMVSVGRSSQADISLRAECVSRNHFKFEFDGTAARVIDTGSSGGTFVNGRRVKSAYLQPGDIVTAGDKAVQLLFTVKKA